MPHFTYKALDDVDSMSLCQGDVLRITDDLRDVLGKIHPYFLKDSYKYFIVITQSCDLVRRNGKACKSPYITLAAVRSFDEFIYRELRKDKAYEEYNGLKLLDESKAQRYYQLLERLYNNTEPEYFFLFEDKELDFEKSMVAYLKVSIALKSELHYEKCLNAKCLELTDEFKAKLGWLVGNIYSRVGTADWTNIKTDKERKAMDMLTQIVGDFPKIEDKKVKDTLLNTIRNNATLRTLIK